jgi:hypothetical protein
MPEEPNLSLQTKKLLKVLRRIAVALEHQNEISGAFLAHATRPRPLFNDYDSGYAAGLSAARAELAKAAKEEESAEPDEKEESDGE